MPNQSLTERSRSINRTKTIDYDLIANAVRTELLGITGTDKINAAVRSAVLRYLEINLPHKLPEVDLIADEVFNLLYGLGPLEKYLHMNGVTDIIVFGTHIMYVQDGIKKDADEGFTDLAQVETVYRRIAAAADKNISAAEPSVDAELYDGSRALIVIPPEAAEPYIVIRRHWMLSEPLESLVDGLRDLAEPVSTGRTHTEVYKGKKSSDPFNGTVAEYLADAVRRRKNIMVIGETGAGKTTLINALTYYVQPNHIVAVLEDTREIEAPLKYTYYFKTREQTEGARAITYEDILNDCLRANPDRIILTEIRTPESAFTLVNVLNSGHRGSMTTIHANSALLGLDKLETLINEYRDLDKILIRRMIARAIDVLVFLKLEDDEMGNTKARAIGEIAELTDVDDAGNYILEYVYGG
ncbi:CpaF family protein [Mahella australiensis]|uniref:Sigma 54 interacting domain protein n=1 Tax=Mahella australiensis (strain DSM 15567 / CIP 107919 / 50-1 BON) TaxID=697281 RepID=F3ZWU1_MAHA5|nr:ATPase, T2SS/T4P/T4SS family [Mahella australiensis]AEE97563.1 Sigma 54 interacting domain protein [Mahella australiensis 50-1 BON]